MSFELKFDFNNSYPQKNEIGGKGYGPSMRPVRPVEMWGKPERPLTDEEKEKIKNWNNFMKENYSKLGSAEAFKQADALYGIDWDVVQSGVVEAEMNEL